MNNPPEYSFFHKQLFNCTMRWWNKRKEKEEKEEEKNDLSTRLEYCIDLLSKITPVAPSLTHIAMLPQRSRL